MRIPWTLADGRRFDVVTLGENSVDLVAVVAEYPAANSKQPLRQFARRPGGQMATAAAVTARLGWRTAYVGAFGDDDLGALARTALTAGNVNLDGSRTVSGSSNRFAVLIVDEQSGSRTVLWDRDPALVLDPFALPFELIASASILIVDSQDLDASIAAARAARAAGVVTIVDVDTVQPGVDRLLSHIDAIVCADGFPEALTGATGLGASLKAMASAFSGALVCATLGERGSLAHCRGEEIRTAPFAVDVVDTTGAGDAFRAGLAAGLLGAPGGTLDAALRYANAVAALNCRGLGAQGQMPTRAEVAALMDGSPTRAMLDS